MELYAAEAEAIKKRVEEWIAHSNYELEATFGRGGKIGEVDATTFLAVAQRLRAKGYHALPQGDYMTVTTPEHIRFTVGSLGVIQAYCEDDVMAGKPYDVMIKDRATAESQVDLDDYGTRIKVRRETTLAPDDAQVIKLFETWGAQKKAFRMIRRWSFEGDGIQIDMSIIRSTVKTKTGDFKWQRKFRDQDIMNTPPTYEIEVELRHMPDDTPAAATKRIIKGIGEILRGIQKNTILIRSSVADRVRGAYKELTGTDLFRGPALITLQKENFSKDHPDKTPNIRDGYNVTDKADGLRSLGFVDGKGDFYLIDMAMNVYRTGLRSPALRLSLVDGEWVTQTKDKKPMQQFLAFDIFYATDKRDVSIFPFQPGAAMPVAEGAPPPTALPPEDSRYNQLKAWMKTWNAGDGPQMMAGVSIDTKLQVAAKDFFFAKAGDMSIFKAADKVLTTARPYYTDGLIFTPNANPLPSKPAGTFWEQFKWKPPADNTIDFLVVTEKVTGSKTIDKVITGIKPGTSGETVTYKTLRLFVGSRTDNPRDIILNKRDLPRRDRGFEGKRGGDYKPVVFTPKEFPDPMASYCCLPIERDPDTGEEFVMTEHSGEPIQDKTIVEMAYDPSQPPKWRWKPLRVRMDKTERYQRGIIGRTLNSDLNAEGVWNSIYDPITDTMIRRGMEEPTETELALLGGRVREGSARQYFDRQGPEADEGLATEMKKFHNRWIKEAILFNTGLAGGDKTLIDLACGVAGDLHKWLRMKVSFVLGVDYAAKNIMDTADSCYTRYMNQAIKLGGLTAIPPMAFAIADSSKPLVDGSAGSTDEEKDILRSVFGKVRPAGSVPAYVEESCASRLKLGADCVSCMFAIHYMFETPEKFQGFLRNLGDTMKVGSYFIGCCPDGQKVFDLLRDVPSKRGIDKGTVLWDITKRYDADDIPEGDGGFGLGIDVEFISIGKAHREYLVPFQLLEDKLRTIGCELLTAEELKEVGMVNSTATFDVSWEMAKKKGEKFPMSPAIKEFSFLNRWFIFKRKRQESVAAAMIAEAEATGVRPGANRRVAATPAAAAAAVAAANAAVVATNAAAPKGRFETLANAARANSLAATTIQNADAAVRNKRTNQVAQLATAVGTRGEVAPEGTVAVAPGPGAPTERSYTKGEVFLFYGKAALNDEQLKMKDPGAGRWLSPSARFPIEDPETKVIYPTVEHYIAGMRMKLATDKPELAEAIFGREGSIHQKFLTDRVALTNAGTKPLSEEEDARLLEAEVAAVKDAMREPYLKRYWRGTPGKIVDEAKWATVKGDVIEDAVTQRWTKDARFRKIVEAARERGKYLLYYTPGASSSNVGGVRSTKTGVIEGQNLIGKMIMKLAGYPE
jgi:predicted NAD-dependent protein-ADP-ribosyltransferase YbiA (DUF1768 family)